MECRVLAILSPTSIWVVVAARNSADFAKPKPKFSIFSMGLRALGIIFCRMRELIDPRRSADLSSPL